MASIGQAPSSPLSTSGRLDNGSTSGHAANGSSSSNGGFAGFASLLRSAGRKSTESLRSVRSSASFTSSAGRRRSFGSSRRNLEVFEPVPPLPPAKDSPSRPQTSAGQSVTSFQSLEPPESGSAGRHHHDMARQVSSRSASRQAPPLHGLREEGGEDGLAPLASETGGAMHHSSPSTSSSLVSRARSARRGLGGLGSKMGLPNPVGSQDLTPDEADGAKTPTGRTTPTQSDFQARNGTGGTASTSAQPQGGDGNTVAQLYAVFGLPKDPSVWTLAEEDCVAGVHHTDGAVGRFWRPEVLGCSICPSPSEIFARQANGGTGSHESDAIGSGRGDAEKKWEGRSADGKKGSTNPKFIEMADGRGRIEKAETARVLSKALKLSFTREIEIVSGQNNYPPMATSHTFSFSVPTLSSASGESLDRAAAVGSSSDLRKGTGAVGVGHHKPAAATGEGYGMVNGGSGSTRTTGFEENSAPATFYGVVLTVWSAADERRAKAVKKELNRAAKQRGGTSSGKDKKSSSRDDDQGAEGFLPANNAYFMPYAICIISRYPLYDLLGDWNKWAWHKYSRNIEMHNKLMSIILSKPAPRLGSKLVVDAADGDLAFTTTFPGALEWGTGLIGIDFTMWPLFKTLSLDNILTICEIALAPNGRVLFLSRHPALLGLAVETIKYFVELRGWQGVANQNCHARDVKIYLEDPGTWIISISTELRSIVKPAKEVCVVDLDINYVNCPNPPQGAPSTKGLREKRKKKLVNALGFSTGDFRPPREFIEAYPGGRFRPMSSVVSRSGQHTPYDQLERPIWWDQPRVITAFDKTLHDGTRPSPLMKLLRMRASKNRTTSEAELAAILALRKRASTFVDARDGLENKIGRLNKRLAFLMSESEMWKAQFSKIQQLVDRLTKEANETRSKLDKERRESRRLSSTLAQRDMERVQLQIQLKETEDAREAAQAELNTMQRAMDSLEHEREAMMDEIRGIISGADGTDVDVAFNMSKLDIYNDSMGHASSRASSPSGSQSSSNMTPSQAADRILKARKAAEDRINEGQPSRSRSRLAAPASSAGHSGSAQRHSPPASSAGNHFPEDQMNYEIQKRTTSVTDQIARIQSQLENTLSQLEDRSKSHRHRRTRRDSNGSYTSSSRYEHRTPSSLGGHGGAASGTDHESAATHHRAGEESELDYESSATTGGAGAGGYVSSGYDSAASAARRERRRLRHQKRAEGPPTSYRGPSASIVAATTGAGSEELAAQDGATRGDAARPRASRSSSRDQVLQERDNTNAWKSTTTTVAPPATAMSVSTKSDATHDSDAPTTTTVSTADTMPSAATTVEDGKVDEKGEPESADTSLDSAAVEARADGKA